ncbi:methyl-accepting chemotaxis protein [Sporosarcina sp. HYO08]|uniref:methyl-accepting chemotaxis protein n=1 Tax=Sporosarcina sp. HYO08 TaxID=1759557 RepID=UPI000796AE95|nr:HAMP domain-containing methyl-accepting chemotaxis protein [Sporosarcina sp. HYO08]KXH83975.1 chemotaxis protein [Sporosarcina sp. HYO08]
MTMAKKKKFGLRKKLVLFVTILAIVTYTTSALFINIVQPYFFPKVELFWFAVITYTLGVVWSGILAALFSTILIKPLQNLEKAAIQIADGKIGTEIDLPNSSDEIRSVAEAFQQMVHNLQAIVGQIEVNFEKTADIVDKLSAETRVATGQAEAVASTITEISTGAEESAMAIQETAEAIEDIRQLAVEVNHRAENSSLRSKEMLTGLQHTSEAFHTIVTGIQKMSSQSEHSLETIRDLDNSAKSISEIVQLVGNIATQTNLLALNASIEAARAGEHGKGFAVVAEEVRILADESAAAVKGISALVGQIQIDVAKIVSGMDELVRTASLEVMHANKASEEMQTMTDQVNGMAAAVTDITNLMERQLVNIEITGRQSQEVAAIAEETSAGAQEVRAATEEQVHSIEQADAITSHLKNQSEQLYQVINQFDRTKYD